MTVKYGLRIRVLVQGCNCHLRNIGAVNMDLRNGEIEDKSQLCVRMQRPKTCLGWRAIAEGSRKLRRMGRQVVAHRGAPI